MPYSLDSGDILTDMVMDLLATSGATGLSLRKLAARQGTSMGTLTNKWGTRRRILTVSVNYFRHRLNDAVRHRHWSEGVLALLPADDDEVEDCRVWLAFCELARADPVVAECVAEQRVEERAWVKVLLRTQLRIEVDDLRVDAVLAVVDGLRLALGAPEPMSLEHARSVLLHVVDPDADHRTISEAPGPEEPTELGA